MSRRNAGAEEEGQGTAGVEDDRLLTIREVAARLTISTRQVQKLAKLGVIPPPAKLGRRVSRWRAGDIVRYIRLGCHMGRYEADLEGRQG